jgi:hypothetical protein
MIKSRRMGLTGHVASMGKRVGAGSALVEKPERRRRLGRPRRKWKGNIKKDLKEYVDA